MIFRLVRAALLLTLLLSGVSLSLPRSAAASTPPAPTLIAEVNGPGKGRVWVGAIPPGSSSKPVLVFVHGLHGKAQNWWGPTVYNGTNDMYNLAYLSGYRTAFVSLDDEVDGPASSMWANGSTLNKQLDVILRHFGVSSVNVIAHSKGGVDTNSAIVHYGASSKIQKLVTLGSPHHGSQLADLAYSWWAWWLAALLGQHDDGTYVMQTGYMSYFRSVTDYRAENRNVRIYTSGGTDHGPWFSAEWFGGLYLSQYGSNDGVVTVASSHHPLQYARLFTADIDHDGIRKGSLVWSRIEPTVRTTWRTSSLESDVAASRTVLTGGRNQGRAKPMPQEQTSNVILRGGTLEGDSALLSLPVEENVREITFDLLAASDQLSVAVIDPAGVSYPVAQPVADEGIFRGAFHYSVTVPKPQSGSWSVKISGPQHAPFLLVADLDSPLQVRLVRDQALVKRGGNFRLSASAEAGGQPARRVDIEALLTGTPQGGPGKTPQTHQRASASGKGRAGMAMTAPGAVGLYQLGVTVTGISPAGVPYERSFPTNMPVITDNMKADTLPAGN